MKRCYYQILQVDRKATATEIKQSYRKMALKYHPDKNSEDDAKQRFVQINEAYNVLSDANQRTWYDNNREKVLFNKDQLSKEDLQQYSFGFNIWAYFTTNCFKGYQDGEEGFYAVYRDVFEKIKTEEVKAYNSREDIEEGQFRKCQGFGDSTTVEEKMLRFYEDWENFTTYKTFVWSEEWDTREANNRWMRRQMEKENKKFRQGEKKTFIKTIKDLIAYVKKRDPRFRDYQMRMKQEEEKKAQERVQKQKRKKQQKEDMKQVRKQLEQERMREADEYFRKQNESLNDNKRQQRNEEEYQSQYYCALCSKQFKSQNQLKNHEKSKQHKLVVKTIEREVLLKEEILNKVEEVEKEVEEEKPEEVPLKKKNKKKKKKQAQQQSQEQEQKIQPPKVKEEPKKEVKKEVEKQVVKEDSDSDDDDAFMNTLLNNRNKKQQKEDPKDAAKPVSKKQEAKRVVQVKSDSQDEEERPSETAKKQKKKKDKVNKPSGFKCNTCKQEYQSKTKLFDHIKKSGHASVK